MSKDGFVATAPSLVYVETAEDRTAAPSLVVEGNPLDDYTRDELAREVAKQRKSGAKKKSRLIKKQAKKKAAKLADRKASAAADRAAQLAQRRSKWEEEGAALQLALEEEQALQGLEDERKQRTKRRCVVS